MSYVQVKQKHQVTIPAPLRKELNLQEGDMLEAKTFQGMLVLIPKLVVSKNRDLDKDGEQERRMLQAYQLINEKQANPVSIDELKQQIEILSAEAQSKGLTQDILDEIINEG